MQNFKQQNYQGTWGSFQLEVDFVATNQKWVGRVLHEGKPEASSPYMTSAEAVVEYIAAILETKGCHAVVNGKRQHLAPFLSFEPAVA